MADANLMTRFETQLATLRLFETFSEAELKERPIADKWSAHENLAHLGHYHQAFTRRVRRIVNESAPKLERYRAEDHTGFARWAALPTAEVIEKMKALSSTTSLREEAVRASVCVSQPELAHSEKQSL